MSEISILPPLVPSEAWPPATRPTLYFIGVTTHQSSIMRIFPAWAEYLGIRNAVVRGMNFQPNDDPQHYRRAVQFIKDDPLCQGALVTTHKLNLLRASRDLFDELDEFATLLHEVSSISKCDGRLLGHAKDAITSGLSLRSIIGSNYWHDSQAELLVCGAGGASIALTWYVAQATHGTDRPRRIVVTDCNPTRLAEIQAVHERANLDARFEYQRITSAGDTDRWLESLPPKSLVVNATGLGKDAPGSPLSDDAVWPVDSIAWDFNYRGDLVFLDQARRHAARRVRCVDGWEYFIHGWSRVIDEVFHLQLPWSPELLADLSRLANAGR